MDAPERPVGVSRTLVPPATFELPRPDVAVRSVAPITVDQRQPIVWGDGRQLLGSEPAAPASSQAITALTSWEQMPHAFLVKDDPPAGLVNAQARRSGLAQLFSGARTTPTNPAAPKPAVVHRPAWLDTLLAALRGGGQ